MSGIRMVMLNCIEKERDMRIVFKITVIIVAMTALMLATDVLAIRFM